MAENSSSGTGLLGVIIGAALVIGVAIFFFGGFGGPAVQKIDVTVKPPMSTPTPTTPASPMPKS